MRVDAVQALLGPPDDIEVGGSRQSKRAGEDWRSLQRTWRYGTDGHSRCATLGEVYLDQNNEVMDVSGGMGAPPPEGMFDEANLRRLLELIYRVPPPNGFNNVDRFDPRTLIAAVNSLRPLGKEKATSAIAEFLRVTDRQVWLRRQGLFLLVRCLFDLPAGQAFPPARIGATSPRQPSDLNLFPRFPLMIVDDVPFLLAHMAAIGGAPRQPEDELEYFQSHFEIRSAPLTPSNDLGALCKNAMDAASALDGERSAHTVGEQLLLLASTVYQPPLENRSRVSRWDIVTADLAKLSVQWDPAINRYVQR